MKKILGMPLALVLIGMLVIGGATAALVGYLSNTVNVGATVTSPIEIKTSLTQDSGYKTEDLSIGSFGAGETFSFYLREEILSDATIDSNLMVYVKNNEGIDSCEEFSEVKFVGVDGSSAYVSIKDSCVYQSGNDRLVYTVASNGMTKGVIKYRIDMTTSTSALGTYSATLEHVPQ